MEFSRKQIIMIFWAALAALVLLPFIFRASLSLVNTVFGRPDLSMLEDYRPIGSIEIYDFEDNFVGVLQGKEDRQVVKLGQISTYMKQSLLAAEDNDFFHHKGFSIMGLFRAVTNNLMAGRIVQGGSTLTQQMVKNLFINEDERYKRTFSRKIRELLIAIEVEDRYDKEKILEIYLNQVYFGSRAYGIERAAQRYFSKPASKLTLLESTYLAGLLTAPSYLSTHFAEAHKRQLYVLEQMYKHGYITEKEYKAATKAKMVFKPGGGNLSKYPYYFSYVEQELRKRFSSEDLRKTGLKVYTGLDPVAQEAAARALDLGIQNAPPGINQAALVSIDIETAEIRALVGGVGNYWEFQFNRAINPHTLGSAFKPFVYLTAFMKGVVDPNTIIVDEPTDFGNWVPKNFDGQYKGPITVRTALIQSRNIPAVKVAQKAGIKDVIEVAHRAGLKSPIDPYLPSALGACAFTPVEVATAYGTLARGGVHMESILIRKITDSRGNLLEKNEAIPRNALPERHVAELVEIMKDVVTMGTGAAANIPGRIIAGKTGTADGSRDTWFTGFTADTVTTIWAGNEMNKEVHSKSATGGGVPAWSWHQYMTEYLRERPRPVRGFSFASDYITVMVDPLTGLLATDRTSNPVAQRFKPGTEPTQYSPDPDEDASEDNKEGDQAESESKRKYYSTTEQQASSTDERIKALSEESSKSDKPAPKPYRPRVEIIPQPKNFRINVE